MSDAEMTDASASKPMPVRHLTFGTIFMRGLAISLPAILTLVILLWAASLISEYVITPTSNAVRFVIAGFIDDSRSLEGLVKLDLQPPLPYAEKNYRVTERGKELYSRALAGYRAVQGNNPTEISESTRVSWIQTDTVYVVMGNKGVPYADYALVASNFPLAEMPRSAIPLYMEIVTLRHFNGMLPLSVVAVVVIITAIYFLGRFMTVQLGRYLVGRFEATVIGGVPVVRNVYGSVKQITDFLFSENQLEVRRVVAFEYPRKGIWSIGFVTGDAMVQISEGANEPCVCILVPTSPMPMTGYTMCVPKSTVIDLNITIEQAFQFIVSCGVLVPVEQRLTPSQIEHYAKHGTFSINSTPAKDQDNVPGHEFALGKMLVDSDPSHNNSSS